MCEQLSINSCHKILNRYFVNIMPRIKQDLNQSCFVRDASPAGTVTVDIPRLENHDMIEAPKWSLINESIRVQKYKNEAIEIQNTAFMPRHTRS